MTSTVTGVARAGVLVDLCVRSYSGRKQDKSTQDEVTHAKGAASKRAASVYKSLFADCAELEAIGKVQNRIRTVHYRCTLPWSDNGSRLLPIKGMKAYKDRMDEYMADHDEAIKRFLDKYDTLVAAAAFKLGSLFDRTEYPTRGQVAQRFAVEVSFTPLPTSGDFRIDAEAELLNDLAREYEERVTARVASAQKDAWTRLHTALTHMADRLTDGEDGKKNKIFDTLVGGPLELCGLLTTLNVTNDSALERARVQLENVLMGTSAEELRKHADARADVKDKVQNILSQFDWGVGEDDE